MDTIGQLIRPFGGAGLVLVLAVAVIVFVRWTLARLHRGRPAANFTRQLVTLLLSLAALLAIIMVLPISDDEQGQLLGLIGILLSAAIALSATTFVGNIMAGLMLRAIRSFRPGDFVRIGEHFGRVSDQGLFHVEIQNEDRDLTTLPNVYLVTNPVKVTRTDGTMVSTEVSLGYDTPHGKIEDLLVQAAENTGLSDPYVYVIELGDFSVTYRVAGLLEEVKHLLSTRSRLRMAILDSMHAAGIEIVSPTFMNTLARQPEEKVIPPRQHAATPAEADSAELPETVVFDKADEAESLENLRRRLEEMGREEEQLKERVKEAAETERSQIEQRLERLQQSRQRLAEIIDERSEKE
jgi:small-conductance mechanosensitive channel